MYPVMKYLLCVLAMFLVISCTAPQRQEIRLVPWEEQQILVYVPQEINTTEIVNDTLETKENNTIVLILQLPQHQTNDDDTERRDLSHKSTRSPPAQNISSEQPILFQDSFSQSLSPWKIEWTGYGTVTISDGKLKLEPAPSTTTETHSALVLKEASWKDYDFEVEMTTEKQLRTPSPEPWEVGWVLFRYTNLEHFYYFIFKPNGVELGKRQGSLDQIFLQTENHPKLELGKEYAIRTVVNGAQIQIYVDNEKVIDYTDNNPLQNGGIGLYTEDAEVYFDDVRVRELGE